MSNGGEVFITLGSGNEFGISDSNMFIRSSIVSFDNDGIPLDLGPATKENFNRLISNMKRLECHLEE